MKLTDVVRRVGSGPNIDLFLEDLIQCGVLPRKGTFFECGAWDGIASSSTYRLEVLREWRGLLVEPMPQMEAALALNRPRSRALMVAVTDRDHDQVEFVEAREKGYSGIKTRLQAVSARALSDGWSKDQWRAPGGVSYLVPTLTLNTIFSEHNDSVRPNVMCLDMEGSEFDALKSFDFRLYGPQVITIEGEECNALLASQGYVEVFNRFNRSAPWEHCFVQRALFQLHSAHGRALLNRA